MKIIVGDVTQKLMKQREIISAYPEKDKLVVITNREECMEDTM